MRKPAPWMCPLDERVLEILDENGPSTPHFITGEVRLYASRARVRERCYLLHFAELVDSMTNDRSHFEITGAGQRYLSGDLDARTKPTPTVDRVLRG